MSDVAQRVAEAGQKIADLQRERAEHNAAADACEKEARAHRVAAFECKKQAAEWTAVLGTLQVRQRVESEEEKARKARTQAEADAKKAADERTEVEKLKAELTALLEKSKAAQPAE